jgi:hypothetical protein
VTRWLVALPLVVLFALGLGGCGQTERQVGSPAVDAWVDDVCESGLRWREDLARRARHLTDELDTADDLEEARDRYVAYFDDAVDRTEELLEDLDGAGAPALERGEDVARDLRAAFATAHRVFADARAQARRLPPDDQDAFEREIRDLSATLEERAQTLDDAFRRIDTYGLEELDRAFAANSDCRELAGRGR